MDLSFSADIYIDDAFSVSWLHSWPVIHSIHDHFFGLQQWKEMMKPFS